METPRFTLPPSGTFIRDVFVELELPSHSVRWWDSLPVGYFNIRPIHITFSSEFLRNPRASAGISIERTDVSLINPAAAAA